MLKRWFVLLLIALLPIFANAQNGTVYPIDLSVMMTPPYGTCLKEYVGSDRITIQALLKDFSKRSNQFVIQLKVTDNRNRVVLLTHFGDYEFSAGRTFTYPMGPNATQGDKSNVLHDLFNNASIKLKNECFDEGAYTFVFQAFDAASYPSRKIALSMPFTYPVFLQGNTVQPLQIYPYENEVICNKSYEYTVNNVKKIATQLGGIAYQWQSANPTGMRVGYHLQVVDLGDINERTKEAIEKSAKGEFGKTDNFIVNTRTYTPFYNHAITEANYVENHAYAWRVMAVTGSALDGELSFSDKNAPVRVFYFCGAPGIEKDTFQLVIDDRKFDKNLHKVKMDTIKSTNLNALALWRDSSVKNGYCGVNVEIRKKGQEKWTPYFVEKKADYNSSAEPTDNSYSFENLNYNTRYEVRAQYVKCDNCNDRSTNCTYAPYSDPLEFMISSPIDSANCGDNLPKLTECGDTKAPKILAGDTIIANGTKVVVDTVSYPNAQDSSIISGKGHICMPIIKNIQLKMQFDQIKINCAKELVKGEVLSVWDEKTCAMINIDELVGEGSTGGKDNAASDAAVEEYSEEKAQSSPSGTLMVDKDGTVKFKTKDGKVEDIGKSISLSASDYQSKNYLADNSHYIEFFNEDKVNNAFDNDENGYYRKMSTYEYFDTPLNKVVLPWLANNPGKLKNIKAREVNRKDESTKFDSVMFIIPSGDKFIQLDVKKDDKGVYDLKIPGWADVDHSTPIFAIAKNKGGSTFFDAGKMMQANYAERTHKLIIVPTKDEYSADVAKIQEQLNTIYGRVGVTYTVEEDRSFANVELVASILEDGLDIGADDESRWQVESGEMKLIRSMYENSHPDMDKKSAYLFLVNHAEAPYESTQGDMPRNQSVGYIFMNNNMKLEDGRLLAHEIGHGVYKFEHTFAYKNMENEKTDNLMDYNNGAFLAHYQWKVMQDSVMFVWKGLQDDEDGFSQTKFRLLTVTNDMFWDYYFDENVKDDEPIPSGEHIFYVTPDGQLIALPATYKVSFTGNVGGMEKTANGCLLGFKDDNGNTYVACIKDNKFFGYYSTKNNTKYISSSDFRFDGVQKVIVGLEYVDDCALKIYAANYTGDSYYGDKEKGQILDKKTDLSKTKGVLLRHLIIIDKNKSSYSLPLDGKDWYYINSCYCAEEQTTYFLMTNGQTVKRVSPKSYGGEALPDEYYYWDNLYHMWIQVNYNDLGRCKFLSTEISDLLKGITIRAGKAALPLVQVAGAIVAIAAIPETAGASITVFTIMVSSYSAASGVVQFVCTIAGEDQIASKIPSTLCGATVGLVVKSKTDNKMYTALVDVGCTAIEGAFTFSYNWPSKLKNVEKWSNGFTVVGLTTTAITNKDDIIK